MKPANTLTDGIMWFLRYRLSASRSAADTIEFGHSSLLVLDLAITVHDWRLWKKMRMADDWKGDAILRSGITGMKLMSAAAYTNKAALTFSISLNISHSTAQYTLCDNVI